MAKTLRIDLAGATRAITTGSTAGVVGNGEIQVVIGSTIYQTGLRHPQVEEALTKMIEYAIREGEPEDS